MRTAGLLTITLLVATTDVAGATDPSGGHQSQQGTQLFGTLAPFDGMDIPFASASVEGRPFSLFFQDGNLVHEGDTLDKFFNNNISRNNISRDLPALSAPRTAIQVQVHTNTQGDFVLRITNASAHYNIYTGSYGILQYVVDWTRTGSTSYTPLCENGYRAVAIPGSWQNDHQQLKDNNSVFTFSCTNVVSDTDRCTQHACDGGVIAKCIDYGYAPWVKGAPWLTHQQGDHPMARNDESARQLHNLCVVAMRADYAGNGWMM